MKTLLSLISLILCLYCDAQNVLIHQILPLNFSVQARYRNDLHIDLNNNYWIAFDRIGLGKFDGNNWTLYDSINGALPVNKVNCITSDAMGNIYAGTHAGLSVYDGTTWQHYNNSNSPLPADDVTTVEINANEIWIGTNHGVYYKNGATWLNYNQSSGLISDSITCFAFGINGVVWAGTKNGISNFYQNTWSSINTSTLANEQIKDMAVMSSNELWISDGAGKIYYRSIFGNFVSLEKIMPKTEQLCNVFPEIKFSPSLKKYGNGILVTMDNTSNVFHSSIAGSTLLLSINPQHQISYILYGNDNGTVGTINQYYFDFRNDNLSILKQYSPQGLYAFYTLDLANVNFIPINGDLNPSNLNINQVNSRINNDGVMHWNPANNANGIFEVPACSGKNTVYASALWIGGYDPNNQLHTACQTYKQVGATDFWPGPLDTINATIDSSTVAQYNRTWKVNRTEIDEFILNYQSGNVFPGSSFYSVPQVFIDWPGNGTGNNSRSLAPFIDNNSDGIYNPYDGDYPQIDGDQEIWWVFNDAFGIHTETNGTPFNFEIHAKAYAYNCNTPTADNDVINYTQFYQYKIINRSATTYNNIYIGLWCDVDLGNASDDYVGCNVANHSGFVYNGDSIDDGSWGYGLNPPFQNVTVLNGPFADPLDAIDNNYNGIIDEPGETNSMNHFMFYGFPHGCCGSPGLADDYYGYLDVHWLDNTHITFGGNGRGWGPRATNIPCDFMFPGTTDSAFSTDWTMPIAGFQPTDMRMLLSSGKFSIAPGETRTIDFAYITTRDTVNFPNFTYNHNEVAKVIYWFENNQLSSCPPPMPVGVLENSTAVETLIVRPNPARDMIAVENVKLENDYIYTISDITGKTFEKVALLKKDIDISNLAPGIYLLRVENKKEIKMAKFIKLK